MTFAGDYSTQLIETLRNWGILKQVISTAVLFVSFFIFRALTVMAVRRWQAPSVEDKRRWIIQIKNVSLIILAAGLFGIWATELRAFAISLVAVAAAIAISTKEVIQCFLGGFYKASAKPFELGDRIEVNGYRGEVIDHNFFSTTLLEIGPARENMGLSGRQVVIPNSMFLGHAIYNQSLQQEYVLQILRLVVYPQEDWKKLEEIMLAAAHRECASFLEPARYSMTRLSQREGLELPRVEPRVTFQYSDDGKLHATLRFPAPLSSVSKVEQAVMKSILVERGEVRSVY
jgi:small-conductance mechanosensitive channel